MSRKLFWGGILGLAACWLWIWWISRALMIDMGHSGSVKASAILRCLTSNEELCTRAINEGASIAGVFPYMPIFGYAAIGVTIAGLVMLVREWQASSGARQRTAELNAGSSTAAHLENSLDKSIFPDVAGAPAPPVPEEAAPTVRPESLEDLDLSLGSRVAPPKVAASRLAVPPVVGSKDRVSVQAPHGASPEAKGILLIAAFFVGAAVLVWWLTDESGPSNQPGEVIRPSQLQLCLERLEATGPSLAAIPEPQRTMYINQQCGHYRPDASARAVGSCWEIKDEVERIWRLYGSMMCYEMVETIDEVCRYGTGDTGMLQGMLQGCRMSSGLPPD